MLEIGAQWIHGQEDNLVYELSLRGNLTKEATNKEHHSASGATKYLSHVFCTEDGLVLDREVVLEACHAFEDIYMDFNGVNKVAEFQNLKDGFDDRFEKYLLTCDDKAEVARLKRGLYRWRTTFEVHDNACESLKDVMCPCNYTPCAGNGLVELKSGFGSVVRYVSQNIPEQAIKLNSPVETIQWTSDDNVTEKCKVKCENGENYNCDHVIVTSSIGYLKKNAHTLFKPSLPDNKSRAIANTGYGNVLKIFLEWEEPFWNEDFEGLQLVWCSQNEDNDGRKIEEVCKKF